MEIGILFFLVYLIQFASAYDLNLNVNASSELQFDISNSYKLIVKNLNYSSGQEEINVTIEYWIKNDSIVSGYPKVTNTNLKQQSTVSRSWTPKTCGSFIICANITQSTADDLNSENDFSCKEVIVIGNCTVEWENVTVQNNESNQSIEINETADNSSSDSSGYNYSVIEYPSELKENFSVKILIINNEETTNFEAWSYVYSSSKCYSAYGRESNKVNVSVEGKNSRIIELPNQLNVSELDSNKSYKLKIKILREGLKTPREFTFDLLSENFVFPIIEEEKGVKIDYFESSEEQTNSSEESIAVENKEGKLNDTIILEEKSNFESKSEKIKHLAAYILLGLGFILAIYWIIKL